jgi:hypothetical protein
MGGDRARSPFAYVRRWRARDKHTGVGKFGRIPYTYEHVDAADICEPRAEIYRVETYIPFVSPTPLHRNVYYLPSGDLPEFVADRGEIAEQIINIRPMTLAEADRELCEFRLRAEQIGASQ